MQMTTHITQLPSSIGCLMKNSAWTQWSGSRLGRVHRTLQTYYRSISRNIGPYSLPKNLPKSHPSTYIPVIGATLVAIWQLGSPSGPSKPEKHHRHQRQLDLPPLFFLMLLSLSVSVCMPSHSCSRQVQAPQASSPQHSKETRYSMPKPTAMCPASASSAPKRLHPTGKGQLSLCNARKTVLWTLCCAPETERSTDTEFQSWANYATSFPSMCRRLPGTFNCNL